MLYTARILLKNYYYTIYSMCMGNVCVHQCNDTYYHGNYI